MPKHDDELSPAAFRNTLLLTIAATVATTSASVAVSGLATSRIGRSGRKGRVAVTSAPPATPANRAIAPARPKAAPVSAIASGMRRSASVVRPAPKGARIVSESQITP